MKGPYERLKYDLRRVWECPSCHHHTRTSGAVVVTYCRCQDEKDPRQRTPMRLMEDAGRPFQPQQGKTASEAGDAPPTTTDPSDASSEHEPSDPPTGSGN